MGFLRGLLSRREWVYLLSLLMPFVVFNLALKAYDISSRPGDHGLVRTLELMRSDIFFNVGYALFWIGLFAAVRKGPLRWVVVFLFHVATLLVVLVTTSAHQYLQETGTTLDYGILALWLPELKRVVPVLAGSVPLSAWILLVAALLYAALGPWLLTRAIGWWRGWPRRSLAETPESSFLTPLGLWLLAFGLGLFSLLIGPGPAGVSKSFARAPVVNVVLTGVKEAIAEEDNRDAGTAIEHPAAHASLIQAPRTEKRNVVLIHLESTRAEATTPYNNNLETTPFLNELAKSSLLVEQAYTTVPHTSKASVSVNCGIFPHLVPQVTEAGPGGIPVRCLPHLLKDQGYRTVLFQSSTEDFENFAGLVKNFGYEEYYPLESMDTEGFERLDYFGYEDDIMLEPSEEWLKNRGDKPFLAEYLGSVGHHRYDCVPNRYGSEDFSEDDVFNRYLNCIRYQDFFLKNLIDQYKELGLYENTIFVIYGDHGEGFGEHGRYIHDDTIYEEGLRVPLIIHEPGRFQNGERTEGPSNLTDILPTVLEMLGYEVKNGEYPGYSLLHPLPQDRTLRFACFHNTEEKDQCLASIKGSEKYIYHHDLPDEFFDLSEDPLEQKNLAGERPEEVAERREDLLAWRSEINAMYGPTDTEDSAVSQK
ncbi:MAG: sulfatase-like hydrolase/transferase [Actinomycetota bacterium]|nr:sulfatase-like hydrolase/transferase [Actinomycetota bacterium]